ncbi:hypothetical protein [Acinetobacter piscicola]|uniref:hypothetical protein n=1 Tax=Acinetobacter piscicola TaxID=2006115 RepID=UPI000B7F204F|nr:hypothetical protein [Acinetobacter piscicola]
MPNSNNQILSALHRIVAFILIFDLIYMFYQLFVDHSAYLFGSFLGKLTLICVHFLCAKGVKSGRTSSRLASIFFTIFMLNAFPLGTLFAVTMLFFSLFKWQPNQTLNFAATDMKG